jgi:hypothetical protein
MFYSFNNLNSNQEFKHIIVFDVSADNLFLIFVMTFQASENNLSDDTLVAGGVKYSLAIFSRYLKCCPS